MRKNKLIEILQNMKGNPEIHVWNGYVGDWMAIKSVDTTVLTKLSNKRKLHFVNLQRVQEYNKKPYPPDHKLEIQDDWREKDELSKYADLKKTVGIINVKLRGKTEFFSRHCPTIHY